MDYEKKYKEALERAKQFSETPYLEDSKGIVEYIFPELAESEDKKMIQYFKDLAPFDNAEELYEKYGFSHKDAIAWLEKKGEQKPADKVEPKFKVGDKVKSVIDGFECTIESIDNTCYYGDTTNFDIQDQGGWELVEQKPWSEEDERDYDVIYGIIYNSCNAEDASRLIAWLKSLKDRVQLQPNQEEWSEEDRITRNALINLVEMYYGDCINKSEKNRLLDWLKSIRPQNWTKEDKERYISCLQRLGTGNPEQPETINSKWFKEHVYPQNRWRPSGEQMNGLKEAIEFLGCTKTRREQLQSLYEQLKKLREE